MALTHDSHGVLLARKHSMVLVSEVTRMELFDSLTINKSSP